MLQQLQQHVLLRGRGTRLKTKEPIFARSRTALPYLGSAGGGHSSAATVRFRLLWSAFFCGCGGTSVPRGWCVCCPMSAYINNPLVCFVIWEKSFMLVGEVG